jgi:ubiquinone/menaquinone biosynthesis C-methylase UbiE
MPDHFQTIYAQHAVDYERLIAREDYQGNILKAIRGIVPLDGAVVAEMGAGTGRLTRLLSPEARSITAMDASRHMLSVARDVLRSLPDPNWNLVVTDNRALPLLDASADLAIEGWSFGHLAGWYPSTWRAEMQVAINEMLRVLRPGGFAVLLETMGTGREDPKPPAPELALFYRVLEDEMGFQSATIRTDYQFESLDEAVSLTHFFFGDELAAEVQRKNWIILPECTGIWWKQAS